MVNRKGDTEIIKVNFQTGEVVGRQIRDAQDINLSETAGQVKDLIINSGEIMHLVDRFFAAVAKMKVVSGPRFKQMHKKHAEVETKVLYQLLLTGESEWENDRQFYSAIAGILRSRFF
jgi:acetylglutamate synthase